MRFTIPVLAASVALVLGACSEDLGEPIVADPGVWTWVDVPEALCMDGSSTGFGINIQPGADRLMIFMEGGGACFDAPSCAGFVANLDGYGVEKFNEAAAGRLVAPGSIFDRDATNNPVAAYHMVYVPYCSGDVFAGDIEESPGTFGRTHVGYRNVGLFLDRLRATFEGDEAPSRILVTGSSAGGLGAFANYEQVAEAFDGVPVDLFNDAGAALPEPYIAACQLQTLRDTWNLASFLGDTECTDCSQPDGSGLWNLYAYYSARFPEGNFGYATGVEDATFRVFFSWGLSDDCSTPLNGAYTAERFAEGTEALRTGTADLPNFHTYYVGGEDAEQHTFASELNTFSASGVVLADWLGDLIAGTATDVGP
jgi:hypothetical protein